MGGYEGTAICYVFLVLFFLITARGRWKTGKPLHATGLLLLALFFLRLSAANLYTAGYGIPAWVRSEETIFGNAVTLVLVSVVIMLDEFTDLGKWNGGTP